MKKKNEVRYISTNSTLTEEEVKFFNETVARVKYSVNFNVPIEPMDHEKLTGTNKEALGICWAEDDGTGKPRPFKITIDEYFIHECYVAIEKPYMKIIPETLEQVIAHEIAHLHVFRRDEPGAEEPETRLRGDLDYGELTGSEWLYDEEGTMNEQEDIEECFMQDFTKMFPSFKRAGTNEWMPDGCRRILLESKLFYICIEDNGWSMALELVQKEEPWGLPWMENLQRRLHEKYLEGMKRCLLERLPSIGTYKGAWRSGILTREEAGIFPVAVLR